MFVYCKITTEYKSIAIYTFQTSYNDRVHRNWLIDDVNQKENNRPVQLTMES